MLAYRTDEKDGQVFLKDILLLFLILILPPIMNGERVTLKKISFIINAYVNVKWYGYNL